MGCSILFQQQLPDIKHEPWRPLVIVSCAISLDGKLASSMGDTRLSSYEDKVEVHKLRSMVDAILVGINTIIADDPHLTVSSKYYQSDRHPIRVVLDSKCRIPINAQVLVRKRDVPTIIATTKLAPEEKIKEIRNMGAEVIVIGDEKVDIRRLLEYLKQQHNVNSLMVEGGGYVLGEFFKEGLVDIIRVAISPVIFGEDGAISMVRGAVFGRVEESPRLKLYRVELCGHNVVLHFYVCRD